MRVANISEHIKLLCSSFEKWIGTPLLQSSNLEKDLYIASFALVSHGTEADPIFNYANLKAQEPWELDLEQFTKLPSRLSAEPMLQEVRNTFMKEVTKNGFVSHYDGIRISATNERFMIKNATVWNIIDTDGKYLGQAAMFMEWEFLQLILLDNF